MSYPISQLTSSGFKGEIIHPGDGDLFAESTKTWGDQGKLDAKLALRPLTVADVSKAITWLTSNNIEFAVRSGGLGDSQSEGVIIDLVHFDKVEYNAETTHVHLGPGQSWHKVYSALSSHPITVLGGRVGFVGVGGFTLGGGLSYLANLYGIAADSLVDAQVVLANGDVVWAKDDEDLFFALRGAGHAFGVVTELVVKSYPKPTQIFGGILLFPITAFAALSAHMCTIKDNKLNTMLGVARMPPDMQPAILLVSMVFDTEEYAKRKDVLGWAYEIGPIMDWMKNMTFEESIKTQELYIQPPPSGSTFQQHNLVISKLTPEIMQAALDWQTELQKDPRFYGASLLFEPFYPGVFANSSSSTDGNVDPRAAWPHSSPTMNIVNVLISQMTHSPPDISENINHLKECIKKMESAAEKGTVLPRYPNYSLAGVPAEEYYGGNLAKLRELKKRFDPKGVFTSGIKI